MEKETSPTLKYEVEIAMLEIYMEEVYNLLVPRSERAPLKVTAAVAPSRTLCGPLCGQFPRVLGLHAWGMRRVAHNPIALAGGHHQRP